MTDDDIKYMRRALRLAARAAGRTSPNPMVGAVVVSGGEIVGEGFHRAAGEPHAEVNALAKAGDAARGATLYTTLEPCAHHGRTPPCVDAILKAGVRRVVAAMRDPDRRTDGKGFRRALREVHRLRDRSDAVLVGIGTVLADDPALTVREVTGRDPLRVVVDTEARTPPTAKIVRAKDPQRTVLFVARDADVRRTNKLREAGVLLTTLPRADGGLDLGAAMRWLGEHGVNTVLSEAGPRVAGALLRGRLADRLMIITAPIAGGDGPPALAGVTDTAELKNVRVRRFGEDIAVEGDI